MASRLFVYWFGFQPFWLSFHSDLKYFYFYFFYPAFQRFPIIFFSFHGKKLVFVWTTSETRQAVPVWGFYATWKYFFSERRWKPSYQRPFLQLFTSPCVCFDAHHPAGLKCDRCSFTRDWGGFISPFSLSFFLVFPRRSGEWTHADWIQECVRGYPASCWPTLSRQQDQKNLRSAISASLCSGLWLQETIMCDF